MKTASRLLLLLLAFQLATLCLTNAAPPKFNIVDYFLKLPADYLEAPPASWLMAMKANGDGTIDLANGYLSCPGDGAQPEFEVALFRYRDGRPLLAVCQGELEGPDSVYLEFFEPGPGGRMRKARRSMFPVADAGNGRGDWQFDLPRHGRTVIVRRQHGGKILHRITWTGEKFQED